MVLEERSHNEKTNVFQQFLETSILQLKKQVFVKK